MRKSFKRTIIATALLTPLFALPASVTLAKEQREPITWNQDAWYHSGLSASEMLDKPVLGESGERIGDVKDIIVDRDGQISKLVVEVGGFFEIGDQHIGVPWQCVTIGQDMQFVQVPLQEVRSGTYSLFGRVPQGERVPAPLTSWRVNELIGDYASLSDVPRYGIVSDVIFDATGKAKAVVVRRAPAWGGHGLYAFPFTGYYPAAVTHPLPYARETVVALPSFDYGQLGRQSLYAGTNAAGSGPSAAPKPRHPFTSVDTDSNRSLSRQEVIAKLPGLAAGFDIADQNNDGAINRPEFDEAMAISANMYGEGARSAHKREIFRSLDMDGDRHISASEAQWRREISANFKAADRNGDGKLGVSEFGLISIYMLATR